MRAFDVATIAGTLDYTHLIDDDLLTLLGLLDRPGSPGGLHCSCSQPGAATPQRAMLHKPSSSIKHFFLKVRIKHLQGMLTGNRELIIHIRKGKKELIVQD